MATAPTVVTISSSNAYTPAAPGVLLDTITASGAQYWILELLKLASLANTDAALTLTVTHTPSGGSEVAVKAFALVKAAATDVVFYTSLNWGCNIADADVLKVYLKSSNSGDTGITGTLSRTLIPVEAMVTVGAIRTEIETTGGKLDLAATTAQLNAKTSGLTAQQTRDALALALGTGVVAAPNSIDARLVTAGGTNTTVVEFESSVIETLVNTLLSRSVFRTGGSWSFDSVKIDSKIYIGAIGHTFTIDLETDLSTVSIKRFDVKKPDGSIVSWDPAVFSTTFLQYKTKEGDLDQIGQYFIQPYIENNTEKALKNTLKFTVSGLWT